MCPTLSSPLKASLPVLCGLLLSITAIAQTPSPTPSPTPKTKDTILSDYVRRRIAPTVGTGGAIGGPTGLFTILDGKTIQKNDFTFSVGYSKFTRDPGDAEFNVVEYSFNYGLTPRVELYFGFNLFTGIRINTPKLLSGFYLPDSSVRLTTDQTTTPAAFVLAPINNRSITGGIFRSINNQPFVRFPFVGQPSGNFGITGAPPFTGTLGVVSNRTGVASFPGIGSIAGSLLPGIVQTTNTVGGVTTPASFTTAPSYLPDAPFINRGYGRSWLSEFTVGAKIRFRKGERFTNFGVAPFYRFYANNANSAAGFNALQNGASPGGNRGDLGVIGFIGSRLTPNLNVSANVGIILNSNPTSKIFGGQRVTLLDRPNELTYGIGFDFPQFSDKAGDTQPIVELRGTKYFGSRTQNAFENNPIELIVGNKYYLPVKLGPLDNLGFGFAYRYQLNSDNPLVGPNAPGFSSDSNQSNGFFFQLFVGRDTFIDIPPDVTGEVIPLPQANQSPLTQVILACAAGEQSRSGSCPLTDPAPRQDFTAQFKDVTGKQVPFGAGKREIHESELRWEATGGRIVGPSVGTRTVHWDLTGVGPGIYELRALYPKYKIKNHKPVRNGDVQLTFSMPIKACSDCETIVRPPACPTSVTVENRDSVNDGEPATFTVKVGNPPAGATLSYTWDVSPGRIIGASDSPSITVETNGLGGQKISARVTLGGLDPRCANTANGDMTVAKGETSVITPVECKLFDSYGAIKYNDEKARLDNLAIQLRDPGAEGYIIAYRGMTNPQIGNIDTSKLRLVGDICPEYRFNRARDYLISARGVDAARIHYVNGGNRAESSVDLWVCPANKTPAATPDTTIDRTTGTCLLTGTPRGAQSQKHKRKHVKKKSKI